jgi:hypothetical protein
MADDWRASIADEQLRVDPALKDFGDVGALAKSYIATKALVGSSIRIPGPDAGEEAVKEYRDKLLKTAPDLVEIPKDPEARRKVEDSIFEHLGRPKEAKEYAAPQGAEIPEEILDALRKEAAEEGLTKRQFEARAKRAADFLLKANQGEKEAVALLKKELGEAFDERAAAARAIAEKMGLPKEALGQMPAAQLRAWANVAKAVGGEAAQVGTQTSTGSKLTPAEHSARANEIRTRLLKERLGSDARDALIAQLVEHESAVASALGLE